MNLRTLLAGVTLITAVGAFGVPPQASASGSIAPGCTSNQPTKLVGQIYGYPDNRALDAVIGVQTVDSVGDTLDLTGAPHAPGYTYIERTNPSLPADGSASAGTKSWAGICMSAKITKIYTEAYPKDPSGVTDKVRYGEAAAYYQPITPGGTNTILIRLPVRHELGGNTGYVNGYLTHAGHRIDPALITRVRAFTHGRATDCGVQGLAASADSLGYSGSLDATYYRIDALSGGQCNAANQTYTLYVDCTCGTQGAVITQTRVVSIANGAGIRVDLSF